MIHDVKLLLLEYLDFSDILSLRLIKEYQSACLEYSRPRTIRHTERWRDIFPNMKTFYVRSKDSNIEYLDHCHTLELYLYGIKGTIFRNFHLKELVLIDLNYLGNGSIDDSTFDYFTELEKLYIEHNHLITNESMKKLKKIKELTIDNCSNITELSLPTLKKLELYNIEIRDESFKHMNLEYLKITFGKITDIGICYLSSLRQLNITGCPISCKGFSCLKQLTHLSISYSPVFTDESIVELSQLKLEEFILYGAKIDGWGLNYLKDVKVYLYKVAMNDRWIEYKEIE